MHYRAPRRKRRPGVVAVLLSGAAIVVLVLFVVRPSPQRPILRSSDPGHHKFSDHSGGRRVAVEATTQQGQERLSTLVLDSECRQVPAEDLEEAMYEVRGFGNVLEVDLTEAPIVLPDGARRRPRNGERKHYVPDDVVTLDSRQALPIASYSSDHVATFGDGKGPAVKCGTAGAFDIGIPGAPLEPFDLTITLRRADAGSPVSLLAAFPDPVQFYGLGNRGSNVHVPSGRTIRAKNLDVNHYALDAATMLYGVVPLLYAVRKRDGRTCGLLVLNGSPMDVRTQENLRDASANFQPSAGGLRLFVLVGPSPGDVLRQYFTITGRPMLPPLFSLGFHQSRWSYRDAADVEAVSRHMKDASLPMDVLWLDIDHTDDKRYFTWNPQTFPEPLAMLEALAKDQRRLVTITDPHIKRDSSYHVFQEAHEAGYFVRASGGWSEFRGHCWPGESSWIDFVNPDARTWYGTLFRFDRYKGSSDRLHSWIDMNEPSVFSGPDTTLPMDVKHTGHILHRDVHNLYGYYHAMAAYGGLRARSNGKLRPFLLTRSFFAGTQRYAAVWTGDNQGKWSHLKGSVEMVLLLSLSGITFVGADVGGFFDNPTPELLVRWFQLGSLYPFFRQHSDDHSRRREVFLHAKEVRPWTTAALRFRYQLLPYLYTVFAMTSGADPHLPEAAGPAVLNHLMLSFPSDPLARDVTDTFTVGDALLARPIVESAGGVGRMANVSVFVPESPDAHVPIVWFGLCGDIALSRIALLDDPAQQTLTAGANGRVWLSEEGIGSGCPAPLFQRSGSIVPLRETVGHSTEDASTHPLELRVALDKSGRARGVLFLDDGVSIDSERRCVVEFNFLASGRLCAEPRGLTCNGFDDHVDTIWVSGLPTVHAGGAIVEAPGHPVVRATVKAVGSKLAVSLPSLPAVAQWCVALQDG